MHYRILTQHVEIATIISERSGDCPQSQDLQRQGLDPGWCNSQIHILTCHTTVNTNFAFIFSKLSQFHIVL